MLPNRILKSLSNYFLTMIQFQLYYCNDLLLGIEGHSAVFDLPVRRTQTGRNQKCKAFCRKMHKSHKESEPIDAFHFFLVHYVPGLWP